MATQKAAYAASHAAKPAIFRFPRLSLASDGWAAVILLSAVVYLPLLAAMPLRTTGDEKSYIAQALEMTRDGHWFLQTMGGVPNYFKGPLFFILLRTGFKLFGTHSPFAVTYMNFAAVLATVLATRRVLWRAVPRYGEWGALFGAGIAGLSVGVFAHVLASQMEAPLTACYAVVMALLAMADDAPAARHRLALWVTIALAGWLKSPLHSVLLGASALLYWQLNGELSARLRNWRDWGAAAFGVLVGVAGYAPAFFFDRAAFLSSYVGRETFAKPSNGEGVLTAVLPLFTTHLMPWTPLLFAAIATIFVRWRDLWAGETPLSAAGRAGLKRETRLLKLTIAIILPTLIFFAVHPFRSAIYALPALPAVAVFIAAAWANGRELFAWRAAFAACSALTAIMASALIVLILHFSPWPPWWTRGSGIFSTSILAPGALIFAALGFFLASRPRIQARHQVLCSVAAAALIFCGLGRVMLVLGEREMIDPRTLSDELRAENGGQAWHSLVLDGGIWSEWGLLNPWLGRDVDSVRSYGELTEKLADLAERAASEDLPGGAPAVFLAPDDKQLASLTQALGAQKALRSVVLPWRRWRVHGRTPEGGTAWRAAWQAKSLEPLERHEYIVVVGVPKRYLAP